MARRKKEQRRRQVPRPALSLNPAILATIVALVVAAILLSLAVIAIRQDGPVGLVWAIPGVYVLLQPLRGIVRGGDQQLRIALRKIDLTDLSKVAVYERTQWGLRYGVASLKFPGRVEEVMGLFLTSRSFTRMVEWLDVPIEVVPGVWTTRRLASERPDLLPTPQVRR